MPITTYKDHEILDWKWDRTKSKLKEISENDAQTNEQLFKQGHLGRHHRHFPVKFSMDKAIIDARINLVTTRKYLSLYLHDLRCSLCHPRLPIYFEGSEECYPISVTAKAVLSLRDVSFAELLHYCWCLLNSIFLANSNYQYQSFARTLFPLLVEEFSLDTLAGKSVRIDIAWYNVQWGNIGEAIAILKQTFGQDFGFVLWLSQLEVSGHVVLNCPGWNEKQLFKFGPHWNFLFSPQLQYRRAVAILRWIPDHYTQSWDGILAGDSLHGFPDDYFLQRLNLGFDVSMMRSMQPQKSTSEAKF
jgi:hypothetical protein